MRSYAITNTRLSMLAVALLFLSGWSAAQSPLGQDAIAQYLFPPELVIAHQKEIGLDDAQKSFIRTELQQAQSHFTDMQWKLKDNMERLGELLKQDTADEERVLAQLDKILDAEREIKRAQISLMVRIKNKLTAEQQTRLRQLRNESALR